MTMLDEAFHMPLTSKLKPDIQAGIYNALRGSYLYDSYQNSSSKNKNNEKIPKSSLVMYNQ